MEKSIRGFILFVFLIVLTGGLSAATPMDIDSVRFGVVLMLLVMIYEGVDQ